MASSIWLSSPPGSANLDDASVIPESDILELQQFKNFFPTFSLQPVLVSLIACNTSTTFFFFLGGGCKCSTSGKLKTAVKKV